MFNGGVLALNTLKETFDQRNIKVWRAIKSIAIISDVLSCETLKFSLNCYFMKIIKNIGKYYKLKKMIWIQNSVKTFTFWGI